METILQLENVTKRFGSLTALDKVSLAVPPGVVYALLGDNGAGKTTAIRILLGLAEPTAGRAEVLGLDSGKHGLEIRRRVGYVAERPTLYEWMTVEEIGWFAAGFYADGYRTNFHRITAELGLPWRQKIKTLSKGQRAKVSLSLALALDPELLVLDEPTSGLDAVVRREFLESMIDRAAAGKTVFLSSHQIVEVEKVADYVAIMRQSKLLLVERLDELKKQISILTITLDSEDATPAISGEILTRHRKARQERVTVRGFGEEDLARLQSQPGVQAVEVHTPSLEEIFVAYMQRETHVPPFP